MKDKLAGFIQHGVEFTNRGDDQSQGVCPFCGKDRFFVNPETLLWDCKVCIINGNFAAFLGRRQQQYVAEFKGTVVSELSENRGIKPQTFVAWGVGWSAVANRYMIPMNGNQKRIIKDIHRYELGEKAYSTSNADVQLFAPTKLNKSKRVWICEGEWDGMALWECFKTLGVTDDVLAVSGAGAFPKDLVSLLSDCDVCLLGDNDAVNPSSGKRAGYAGVGRTSALLSGIASSVRYLHWPGESPAYKSPEDGYDIRDKYRDEKFQAKALVEFLETNLKEEPPSPTETKVARTVKVIKLKDITREDVITEYRKWLHLKDPEVLDIVFGSVYANRINVDPLWIFFISPPGGGKTELLMSLATADKMASTTSLTPHALISGANFGGGDPSLVPKLNGKTLIIKDFTTILSLNQTARDEIFGILRDVYDGKTEKYFGNGVHRNYKSRFGILAGVTPAIEGFASSNSVLGERFIKYKIKQPGSINVGDDAIRRALGSMCEETTMRTSLQTIAKRVLGRKVEDREVPRPNAEAVDHLLALSKFVAALRGVVSKDKYTREVMFLPCSEIGTRLSKQLCALAMGISVYKRDTVITTETLQTITRIAIDTAPDRVEKIIRHIFQNGNQPVLVTQISEWTSLPTATIQSVLDDMLLLKIVKKEQLLRSSLYRLNYSVVGLIHKAKIYESK